MSQSLLINPTAFEAGLEAAFAARGETDAARRAAFGRFAASGFPHRRIEGWRWSDFRAALRKIDAGGKGADAAIIPPSPFAALEPIEIRIVDGVVDIAGVGSVDGLSIFTEHAAPNGDPWAEHPIVALNGAMAGEAVRIVVAEGAKIDRPVLLRHVATAADPAFGRIVISVGDGAALTLVETYEGDGAFYSGATRIEIGAGARIDRILLNETGADSVVHGGFSARLGAEARLSQTSLSTGGALTRHETHLDFAEPGGDAALASAALVGGAAHADFTSLARYAAEDCATRQVHKGVARDRGRLVFQGKFLVDRPAQKTDAQMTANALLLSDQAEANHKPELEIYADDVECAHGSTAGALDDAALFYLRQRGLTDHQARALLIEAFVGEALDGVEHEGAREVLQGRINAWLETS